jgi:hypothetical protein
MERLKIQIDNLRQNATGSITVNDYTQGVVASATGTLTVTDYESIVSNVSAEGTIEVTDYTLLTENAAVGTIEITDEAGVVGKSFTVNGNTYTEGVHFVIGEDADETADVLATLISIDEDFTAVNDGGTITITAAVAGTAGNSIALSTTAISGVTLSGAALEGGRDNAEIIVGDITYIQGTDFTSETDNDTTAENIAAAIDADAHDASATDDIITITANDDGTAGDDIELSSPTGLGLVLSGETLEGGSDGDVITVGEETFVAGVDFTATDDNDTTATSIASAIDGGAQGASATDNVITITAAATGAAGNSVLLSFNGEGITVSGEALEGGTGPFTITLGEETLVSGTDFDAEDDNETTAENIAAVIDALELYHATATGNVISILYDEAGEDGNVALEVDDGVSLTVSGTTLTGGTDATYTTPVVCTQFANFGIAQVASLVTLLEGTEPTVQITPQVSYDYTNGGATWEDAAVSFTLAEDVGQEVKSFTNVGRAVRFKIVLGGTLPEYSGKLYALIS